MALTKVSRGLLSTGIVDNSNATAITIDSSENVGIGTSSPSSYFAGATNLVIAGSGDSGLTVASGTSSMARLLFADGTSGDDRYRGYIAYSHASNSMSFATDATERMRIDSSGNLLVGTTSEIRSANDLGVSIEPEGRIYLGRGAAAGGFSPLVFINSNGTVGTVTTSGSATAYNTSSDYRLKENVVAMSGATERLKQLNPSRFNFIADADTTVDGFLAHEVQDVVPEAITGTKDAMKDEDYEVTPAVLDDDDNVTTEAVMGTRSVPDYQGIDQSKLVPLLVATIQELEARLTALENN